MQEPGIRPPAPSPGSAAVEAAPAAGADPDAPLLVLSYPRSGTTLLRVMLQGHPEIAILPEPWWMVALTKALGREQRLLTRGLATSYLAGYVSPSWLAGADLALEEIVALLPPGPMREADVVSAVGRAYANRSGKTRWGAKYPGAEFRRALPLMARAIPGATFVFLARDVRDVYLSQVGAGMREGTEDLYLYCLLWAVQTARILNELDGMRDRSLVVRYEDLVEAPGPSLERLCEAAGLATSPAIVERMLHYQDQIPRKLARNPMHRHLQEPVLATNRRKFASRLSPEQVRRTEILAGTVLKRLGYAENRTGLGLVDGVSVAGQLPLRLALNAWRSLLGKSTISGMRLKRWAAG
ncbi:MAG TPA: sulfotransferase [Gemmatimonadota bacterium]|jgi:hypothetical protein